MVPQLHMIDFRLLEEVKRLSAGQGCYGPGFYQWCIEQDWNKSPSGSLNHDSFQKFGQRMEVFYDAGFIRLRPGEPADLVREPFMFVARITAIGELALARGPGRLFENLQGETVNNFQIGSVSNSQIQAGNNNQQEQRVQVNVSLQMLMEALERSIEEADEPDEKKAEKLTGFQAIKEFVTLNLAAGQLGELLTKTIPFFAG